LEIFITLTGFYDPAKIINNPVIKNERITLLGKYLPVSLFYEYLTPEEISAGSLQDIGAGREE
jgi:hypothetical protein